MNVIYFYCLKKYFKYDVSSFLLFLKMIVVIQILLLLNAGQIIAFYIPRERIEAFSSEKFVFFLKVLSRTESSFLRHEVRSFIAEPVVFFVLSLFPNFRLNTCFILSAESIT